MLDGGETHVSVGQRALHDAGLDIPIFGMVKDEYHKTRALCDSNRELGIATEQAVYVFIYRIQEEAHRFARSHAEGAKRKTLRRSELEKIPGIGPSKAKILLSHFGSIKKLRLSEKDEIAAVKGVSKKDAEAIVSYFNSEKNRSNKK